MLSLPSLQPRGAHRHPPLQRLARSAFQPRLPKGTIATIATGFALSPLAINHGMSAAIALPALPDGSTLTEVRDAVTGSGTSCNDCLIQGNTHNNQGHLFHSFSEFNVPTGSTVTFDNVALDGTPISRIFSRVTGTEATEILGELGTLGGADLFLINPQGLLIGPGAVLNIGGSFVGSTAEAIAFSNNASFSTQAPSISSNLLAINTPIGLQFGSTVAPVEVQSAEINFPGRTLALAGAEAISPGPITDSDATGIRFNNSNLFLTSGGLELASLAPQEFLNLADTTTGLVFVFPALDRVGFGNLSLRDTTIQGLNLPAGGNTALYGDGVELVNSNILLESDGTGTLGQIFSSVQQLTLDNSVMRTVNSLEGGEIILQNNSIASTQSSPNSNPVMTLTGSELSSTTVGNGGDLLITTFGDIQLQDNSTLVTQATTGAAGDIDIILSSTNLFFFGQAGTLSLDQGSRISTITPNQGGNIAIGSSVSSFLSGGNSGKLTLSNGSYISAESNPGNTQGGTLFIPSNLLGTSAFESVASQDLAQDNDIFVVGSTLAPQFGVTPSGFDLTGNVTRNNGRSEIGFADSAPETFTSRFTPFAPSIPLPSATPPVTPPPPSTAVTEPTTPTAPTLPATTTPTTTPTNSTALPQQPSASVEPPVDLLALNGLVLPTTIAGVNPTAFSPEAVAIASEQGTVVLDAGNLTLINPSGAETFEVSEVEAGLTQELPLSNSQKQTIAAAFVALNQQQQQQNQTDEKQQISAASAQNGGTSSWVRPGCPVGEEANFSGLTVLGLGGVPAAPSSLTSTPRILVDLGAAPSRLAHSNQAELNLSDPKVSPKRRQKKASSLQEAVGWQIKTSGTVHLMTSEEAIARPPQTFRSATAPALAGLRLTCLLS